MTTTTTNVCTRNRFKIVYCYLMAIMYLVLERSTRNCNPEYTMQRLTAKRRPPTALEEKRLDRGAYCKNRDKCALSKE